jgi:plasmid maintenance system antidote protein VapI
VKFFYHRGKNFLLIAIISEGWGKGGAMAERTELGRRIAAACAMKGISMTTLADRIGVARNTLSRIVTGETADPASGIMVKIAKELGVSLDFLFGLSEDLNASELEPAAVAMVGA